MQACPNATLLAHPRAVPHLVDPSKLVSSAKKVYGEESFQRFYGAIQPISSQRVREVQDGQNIPFGSSTLHFFYTRGHANHHMCIVDSASEGVFTGDSFGLAYPILQKKGLFIFPSTSPTDFDPIEACISIQKILRCGAKKAYLTHFGEISRLQEAADQLLNHLDFSQRLFHQSMNSSLEGKGLDEYCLQEERAYFEQLSTQKNLDWDSKTWDLLDLDIRLNAMGVAFSARKKRQR
jgi:glyoxylase-like metal-dependent hydrolase (beta-lactamase superfamily II)